VKETAVARPFDTRDAEAGQRSRLFGRKRTAALNEIEQLLAGCAELRQVSAEDVAQATAKHGVTLDRKYRGACRDLYRRLLQQCLDDHELTENERADLAHLKTILSLEREDITAVHEQTARTVYGKAVEHVLEDHKVDQEEAEFLRCLREELELPERVADSLYEQEERRARHRYFSKTISTDNTLLASHVATLELTGRSENSVEDAVNSALEEACRAVPELGSAEISQVRVRIRDGVVAEWEVDLKARLDRNDAES
jgi:flavin-binding protein dodecin